MPNRSKEEVNFAAHILRALGLKCTRDTVVAALIDGARNGLWDMRFAALILYVDYDGGHYHTKERIERDESKTREKLDADRSALVLRVRVKNAAPLALDEHPRLSVVSFATSSLSVILPGVARALASILPEPFAERLRRLGALQRAPRDAQAAAAARDAIEELVAREKRNVALLEETWGRKNARALLKIYGVARLLECGALLPALQELRTALGLTQKQVVTFMCAGVAARLESPAFMAALATLREDFTAAQIVTFMSNSVAARLESPVFMEALAALREDFSAAQIVTFMSNSVAARLESPAFMAALAALRKDFNTEQVVTFMCDGVAARLESPAFMAALAALREDFTAEQIVTFMSNSVAARLESPAFMAALATLRREFTAEQIVAFMCDGVAARLESPTFTEMLRKMRTQQNLTSAELVTRKRVTELIAAVPLAKRARH
jgi:hypothetical protein